MESTEPATGSDWKAFGLHRDPHQGGGLCPETQGVHSGQRLAELRGGNGHQMCGSVPAPVNRKEESDPFSGSSKCFDLLSGLEGCGGSPRTEVSLPSGHTGASGGALPTVTCPAQTTAHLFREPCPRRIHHHNQLVSTPCFCRDCSVFTCNPPPSNLTWMSPRHSVTYPDTSVFRVHGGHFSTMGRAPPPVERKSMNSLIG